MVSFSDWEHLKGQPVRCTNKRQDGKIFSMNSTLERTPIGVKFEDDTFVFFSPDMIQVSVSETCMRGIGWA